MYVGLDGSERGGTNEGMMQLMQTGRNNLDTDRCSRSRQTYRPEFQIKINIQRFKKKERKKGGGWETTANAEKISGKAGKGNKGGKGGMYVLLFPKQQKKNNHRRGTMVERVTINITCRKGRAKLRDESLGWQRMDDRPRG